MSKNKLTLSIVIPAYNEQHYISKCLDSILAQTQQPDEVIVVNNNSSDETAQLSAKYPFVKLLHEPRQSVFFACNKGFNAAKGDVIGRIDADTILPPDWTLQVLAAMADEPIAAVTGPVNYYDMPFPSSNYLLDHLVRKLTHRFSSTSPFLYGSNMAMRAQAWDKVKLSLCSNQKIHEDIDLAIHMRHGGLKIGYSKKLLSGASGRRINDSLKNFFGYLAMYPRTFHRHGLYPLAIYPALFIWGLGYVLIHPWRNLWYRLYSPFNKNYPLSAAARKNPMRF